MKKKTNTEKRRGGIVEYLSVKAELPSDVLSGEMRIELRGRNTLFVHGCKRIIKYSAEEMILGMKSTALHVAGDRLICTTYHSGVVTVEGFVKKISFDDGEAEN